MESNGDLSASAIVTGRDLSLATVRLFYACRSVSKLQEPYVKAASRTADDLGMGRQLEIPRIPPVKLDSGEFFIGNRICPPVAYLESAISKLVDEFRICEERMRSDDPSRHHNLFTLYTIWMFSYTTGIRGIKTPFLPISAFDAQLNLAKIKDKDTGLGYKTRLVWIWPELHKQMLLYNDFLSRSLKFPGSDWPCFFVDKDMRPEAVTPKSLGNVMKEFLPFPVNIHRRFVSSELLDRGCPQEIVSAWMGHWHRGEEPWARFSTFSFSEYRNVLAHYLVPLLEKDLGFRAVKSL